MNQKQNDLYDSLFDNSESSEPKSVSCIDKLRRFNKQIKLHIVSRIDRVTVVVKQFYCAIFFVLVAISLCFLGVFLHNAMIKNRTEVQNCESFKVEQLDAIINELKGQSRQLETLGELAKQNNDSLLQKEVKNITREINRIRYTLKDDTITVKINTNK